MCVIKSIIQYHSVIYQYSQYISIFFSGPLQTFSSPHYKMRVTHRTNTFLVNFLFFFLSSVRIKLHLMWTRPIWSKSLYLVTFVLFIGAVNFMASYHITVGLVANIGRWKPDLWEIVMTSCFSVSLFFRCYQFKFKPLDKTRLLSGNLMIYCFPSTPSSSHLSPLLHFCSSQHFLHNTVPFSLSPLLSNNISSKA